MRHCQEGCCPQSLDHSIVDWNIPDLLSDGISDRMELGVLVGTKLACPDGMKLGKYDGASVDDPDGTSLVRHVVAMPCSPVGCSQWSLSAVRTFPPPNDTTSGSLKGSSSSPLS